MKKSICIISFSEIARDARVLRQINYLSPHYELTVIGLGEAEHGWSTIPNFEWKPMAPRVNYPFFRKALVAFLMFLGKIIPVFYEMSFWMIQSFYSKALYLAAEKKYDVIYSNDWNTLPIAVKAAKQNGAKVIFDAHEYGPLQNNKILYKFLIAPEIRYILRKNLPFTDASITVSSGLAEKYREEFGINPIVVMNIPEENLPIVHELDPDHIRLIHHGIAAPSRKLENMIYMIAHTDARYTLHLMLMGNPEYVLNLQELADKIAPGRVVFEDTVKPNNIPGRISEFDIGLCMVEINNLFNRAYSLPNKFFDWICAGLAVCIGPYPEMGNIVQRFSNGCISSTFKPEDVARKLCQLSNFEIEEMKKGTMAARKEFNADKEMNKLINLVGETIN